MSTKQTNKQCLSKKKGKGWVYIGFPDQLGINEQNKATEL